MNMLKVVLVEDEELIREGIYYGIDWTELGYTVAGQAENGLQALQVVDEVAPDVIITDIRMPFLNGLEFIEQVREKHPDTAVIIISGHDEFLFAQKAVKLAVHEYILKPIDLNDLQELLIKLSVRLKEKTAQQTEVQRMKKQSNSLTLERTLRDFMHGNSEANVEATETIRAFKGNYYAVLTIQIDDFPRLTGLLADEGKAMDQMFRQAVSGLRLRDVQLVVVEENRGECHVCAAVKYLETFKNTVDEAGRTLRDAIAGSDGGFTITVAVGKPVSSLDRIGESYKQAQKALNYKFIVGGSRNITFKEIEMLSKQDHVVKSESVDFNLLNFIKTCDRDGIRRSLVELTADLQAQGGSSYLYMQMMAGNLYVQVMKVVKETGGSAEEVLQEPMETYRRLTAHQTLEGMTQELLDICLRVAHYIDSKKKDKFGHLMEKAKVYIQTHYAEENLSLESVALYVNMGSSYFSVIFKQETGETFIDYLTRVRMDKAKELLQLSGYKAYEIAYMVGYNNPSYFSTLFKKQFQVSPTDFRSQYDRKVNRG
jgi:two-component system response regulator YesN